MTLVNAGLLVAGVVAAAIPILIHLLFRRRRPPIQWAAMEILLAAFRQQQRRLRLEQIVLLVVRCLLFALLGFALARPILERYASFSGGGRSVVLVLDDGAASQVRTNSADATSAAFERLRADAIALVRGLEQGDAVGVVLASRPSRAAIAPPTTDREAVARLLETLQPSAAASDLAGAITLAGTMGETGAVGERSVVVLSEFRLGSLDVDSARPGGWPTGDGAPRLVVRTPADDDVANVAVTSIEPQRSIDDDSVTVVVRVERSGGANAETTERVSLEGDGIAPVPAKQVRFDPGQASVRCEFVVRALSDAQGSVSGKLAARIVGDRMPLDDVRYATFDARGVTRIGVVSRRAFGTGGEIDAVPASRWLQRALEPTAQPGIDVVEVEPVGIDARTLRDIDALWVPRPETVPDEMWPELRGFVDRGGLLVLMPSADVEAQRWLERFSASFGMPWQIGADAPPLPETLGFATDQPHTGIFAAVEAELAELLRPVEVTRRLEIRNVGNAEVALALSDGSPFLVIGAPATATAQSNGLVAMIASAPELSWTNLPVKPFMVPFAQEIVRRGLTQIGRSDRILVGDRPAAPRDSVEAIGPGGEVVGFDRTSRMASNPFATPGVWSALDDVRRPVAGIATNVDTSATRMTPQSREAISAWLAGAAAPSFVDSGQFVASYSGGQQGPGIGFWLLCAVAILAIGETFLARIFSHAATASGSAADPGLGTTSLVTARAAAHESHATGVAG